MKYLIFSDSHGMNHRMRRVIDANLSHGLDGVLFCGDGIAEFEELAGEYPALSFAGVAGNCDSQPRYLKRQYEEFLFESDGHRILMLHGHRQRIKDGTDFAEYYARQKGADILLFGHTHVRCELYRPAERPDALPLYLFNPGSITLPKDSPRSFGLLELSGKNVLFSHGSTGY